MGFISRFMRIIDGLSEVTGRLASYLILGSLFTVFYEIAMRYVFSRSQDWTFEMSTFLFGTTFVLAGAYALKYDAHVRIDIFYMKLSPRNKALVEIITSIFMFVFIGVLIWKGWESAWRAVVLNEHTDSAWAPPRWPIKMVIPVGAFLVLLQGIVRIMRNIYILTGKKEPE
ncbi:MAG: TRAP transporter small permease subunit [Deltaproteobacteria bacterium]|nr:TRAP transporter small permease subunit [Deltaproteobacteria bacterium]